MRIFARRYELKGLLGRGGNGVVHLAHDRNLNRDVAIKLFGPGLHPGLMFREAQVHVHLAGPRVLEVLDAAIYNDIPFIVTRVALQGSAMDKIQGTKGVLADTAIRWTRHLLTGLDACHKQGLLHRDVKPGNLFLMNEDSALLGDFGMLERMTNGSTPARGTPAFMPPETSQSQQMNVQSDVYACGLTLWMLLTGAHPFIDAATPIAEFPRLGDTAPHIPRKLAAIVEKACSTDAANRYPSADSMDQALGSLPRIARLWAETAPEVGELRRWISSPRPNEAYGYTVIVRASDTRFDVEARKSGGSARRSTANCARSLTARQLPVRLRKIFKDLS